MATEVCDWLSMRVYVDGSMIGENAIAWVSVDMTYAISLSLSLYIYIKRYRYRYRCLT